MTNIIDFPNKDNTKNFNDRFCDKEGKQIFIKNTTSRDNKYLLDERVLNEKITIKDDILFPLIVDCEFSDYQKRLSSIDKDFLEKDQNKFRLQYQRQQDFLSHVQNELGVSDKISLEDIASGKLNKISKDILEFENMELSKLSRNQMISTQFKHCLHDDEVLFFNPQIKNLVDKYVGDKELFYKEKCHILDYLKHHKGLDVEIIRESPDMSRKEFHKHVGDKNEYGEKMRTCTITIYAFFLIAELCKIFEGELLNDIAEGFRRKKIQMKRRVSTGLMSKFYPNWLIKIGGITYKLAIDFGDTGALQGNISLGDNLKNLGMGTDAKKLMDDYKSNMLLGLVKYPKEWKKYALGDLCVYEVFKNFSKLFDEVYKQLDIEKFTSPPKLTVGATVNKLTESIFLKHLGYQERNDDNLKDLHSFTIHGSPKTIGKYTNRIDVKKDKNRIRKKHLGAKTAGGRCFLNKQVILATTEDYSLCDIDISSAYTSIISVLVYPFGNPVVQSFTDYKVTLRDFLNYYYHTNKLVKRGFKLIVETKEPLNNEQDLLVSFPTIRSKKQAFYNRDGDFTHSEVSVNTDNMETAIYTTELYNTPISWDDLDIILNTWETKNREEFLDKVTMVSAVYYPNSFKCENIEEVKAKRIDHFKNGNGRFKDEINHSWIDNEEGEISHYWCSTNVGKLMMNDIIQLRRKNKKNNFSLSYLFKLIGNTVYGNSVSKHFDIGNVVYASNITAMCRVAMWCSEKALDIHQTITDGGAFLLNEVLHKYRNKLDSSMLVRAYNTNKREMARAKKWNKKPITKNEKPIEYIEGKGWLCDDIMYEFDKDKVIPLEEKHKNLKEKLGENHKDTKEAKKKLDESLKDLEGFKKTINKLALEHVKSQFGNVDIFTGDFERIKVNDDGIALTDFKGDFIYEITKGLLDFEVKNMCLYSVFRGSADYMYKNTTDNLTIKMRGYESKKDLVAVRMEDNKYIYDDNYYNDISPTRRFLEDLKNNPNSVSIPLGYFKQGILKPNEFTKNYKRLWSKSNLYPGDSMFKFMIIPIHTMRNKFLNYGQHKNWTKYQNSLKRRGGGLGFEQFYLNEDGTIRYQDMLQDIDKYIREGVMHPIDVFDKNMNFFRNMKLKKNEKIYQIILNHIKLTTTMKTLNRILTVGLWQFCVENKKGEKDCMIILRRTLKNISAEYHNDYDNLNKYSFDHEFKDKELKLAI